MKQPQPSDEEPTAETLAETLAETPAETPAETLVRGTVARVTFRNPENGYSVLQVAATGEPELLTVVGSCLQVSAGVQIMARGRFERHPRYGRQLNAAAVTVVLPEGELEIERYLGSGIIPGIGTKTAASLVKHFGAETLTILEKDPARIREVPGINKRRARALCQTLTQQQGRAAAQRYFIEHDLSVLLTNKILDCYGLEAVKIVTEDPYRLANDIRGVGFQTADGIAFALGIEPDAPQRLRAGLLWALEKAAEDGHCFLERGQWLEKGRTLLGVGPELDFESSIAELQREGRIIEEDGAVYFRPLHAAEELVAAFCAARCAPWPQPRLNQAAVAQAIAAAERAQGIELSAEQRLAVELAAQWPLLLITGGPGCGKTTVIKALTLLFRANGLKLALAAPTGKAAQRMAELAGQNAKTIHRLLRYDPATQSFQFDRENPLCSDEDPEALVDAIIVDEASMIDIFLARSLVAAIPEGATLILVGDKDQLPSVGPGRVFAELLAVPDIRTISLTQLFRRQEESRINTVAHLINSGITPEIPEPDGVTKSDVYFIARSDPGAIAALVENLVADQLPQKFKIDPADITVLSPSNRGPIGVEELNLRLQQRLNPAAGGPAWRSGTHEFRLGDRVCQRKNNYRIHEMGVFNGDQGRIYSIDPQGQNLVVDLWDGRLIKYEAGEARDLSLAYAVTVHRSQGSELPCVVLVLHDSHFILLERQLFYTAVTRAKHLLIIVGSRRALMLAAKRSTTRKRNTRLTRKVTARLG